MIEKNAVFIKSIFIGLFTLISVRPVAANWDDDVPKKFFDPSTIPPILQAGAKAVIRYERTDVIIKSTKRMREKVHRIITILNPDGRDYGIFKLHYDEFKSIDDLDGSIYDANGKEIRSLSKNDQTDESEIPDYSLYTDARIKTVSLYHDVYPYTIELEYTFDYDGYLSWPDWHPEHNNIGTEYSSFEIHYPENLKCRYRPSFSIEPLISRKNDEITFRLESRLIPPFESEPDGPHDYDQVKMVEFYPIEFEIAGTKGSYESWKEFGSWFYRLQEGRQNLPQSYVQELRSSVQTMPTNKEKIEFLYKQLQKKTHYVSIQLGIGGWQPFEASFVHEKCYGDCKALVNYIKAMLSAVDIPSYPVLIFSEVPKPIFHRDYPSNDFNHVILAVPIEKDTLWLECTNEYLEMNRLSPFTEDRFGLMITPTGGVLVKTPATPYSQSCQIRRGQVKINLFGNTIVESTISYSGNQNDIVRMYLQGKNHRELEEWERTRIRIPSFTLNNVQYNELDKSIVDLKTEISLQNYCQTVGSRIIFQPNLFEKTISSLPENKKRKYPVLQQYPYCDIDTLVFSLPEIDTIEVLPAPVNLQKPFGMYSASIVKRSNTELVYTRRLAITTSEIPASDYEQYRLFFRDVSKADQMSVILSLKK